MKKKLYRSNHGLVCGVCTGIAEYFGIRPYIVRGLFLLAAMVAELFPPMVYVVILAYIILALVMPRKNDTYNDVLTMLHGMFAEALKRDKSSSNTKQCKKVTDATEKDITKGGKD